MPSVALRHWTTTRRSRIDELYAAHVAVGGSGRGRRTATRQVNWAITLQLAGEFQGYARELHAEAADIFVLRSNFVGGPYETAFRNLLVFNRKLDKGNATKSNLKQDFTRLGFDVLDQISSSYLRGSTWLDSLEKLNTARNGIAHSDLGKIAEATEGRSLDLALVRNWDASMRALAKALDTVTAKNIAALTKGRRPW